mmetsp:Transcript_106183/g.342528  ORF Transcript_106183/g.342528 Transcript_106183/m.342528 type:complete len:349 (-) Transcript_106183:709-1755(-)
MASHTPRTFKELLEMEESLDSTTPCLQVRSGAHASSGACLSSGQRCSQRMVLVACVASMAVTVCWVGAFRRHGASTPKPSDGVDAGSLLRLDDADWTTVRWLAHPEKCLDVGGSTAGAALQIWDCDPNYPYQQQFTVPADGATGLIKWAKDPSLCLDSPGGHGLQFWACDSAPTENVRWTVSPDGKGRIHWAAHPEQCLDVPDEITDNGWKLQVWWCKNTTLKGKDSNLRFVTHAVDCKWGDWQDWGPCSVSCGGGQHLRSRSVARQAMNGGHDCGINGDQSEHCNLNPCMIQTPTVRPPTAAPGAEYPEPHLVTHHSSRNGASRLRVGLALLCAVGGLRPSQWLAVL